MKRTLYFRLIKDETLDLNTRILYTYLFKWANINHNSKAKPHRYTFKPITKRRMLRATGFNWKTISKSLNTLISNKYVDSRYAPLLHNPNLLKSADGKIVLYRKVQWEGNTDIKRQVAKAFIRSQDALKSVSPNYFVKVLGLSRMTVYRLKQALTVDTRALTVDTNGRLPLIQDALTVDTVSNTVRTPAFENPKKNTPAVCDSVTECLNAQKDDLTPMGIPKVANNVNEFGEEILGSFFANLCRKPPPTFKTDRVLPVEPLSEVEPPEDYDAPAAPTVNQSDPYAINCCRPTISFDEADAILADLCK